MFKKLKAFGKAIIAVGVVTLIIVLLTIVLFCTTTVFVQPINTIKIAKPIKILYLISSSSNIYHSS